MVELKFDSIYTFLVSIGTIIIAITVLFLNSIMNGSFTTNLLLDKSERLSEVEKQIYEKRINIILFFENYVTTITIISLLIGIIIIIIGVYMWLHKKEELTKIITEMEEQKLEIERIKLENEKTKIDIENKKLENEKLALENKKLSIELEKMTESEIKEDKKMDAVQSENLSIESKNKITKKQSNRIDQLTNKHLTIENNYYQKLLEKNDENYRILRNVKIPNPRGSFRYCFDFVAESLCDDVDIIYEIKYTDKIASFSYYLQSLHRLEDNMEMYRLSRRRNCKSVFVIFTTKENELELKKLMNGITTNKLSDIDIEVEIDE